jgi:hypothetical protein
MTLFEIRNWILEFAEASASEDSLDRATYETP